MAAGASTAKGRRCRSSSSTLAAIWLVVATAAAVCVQHGHAGRIAPSMARVSSVARAAGSKDGEGTNWIVGDIFVASHNDVGFPRIDILDPEDLSVKDSLDLVPACGVNAATRGLSFSPRFSSMKLQLAASCAPHGGADANDGKVLMIAAKNPQHPTLRTLSVPNAAASTFNRSGVLYVFGTKQQAASSGGNATARPSKTSATAPVLLFRFDAAAAHHPAAPTPEQQEQQEAGDNSTTAAAGAPQAAADVLEVATAMPASLTAADAVSMDLGPRGQRLYYTLGASNTLKTYDMQAGAHLRDRTLPGKEPCSALQALFDGSLLAACGKCLYQVAADNLVLKSACLPVPAPFGKHMALDPDGANALISTTDGNLHVIRLQDMERVHSTSMAGRSIGGLAVLGTVLANQQDCTPGTGCCPFGRILPSDAVCRTATADSCTEDAVCDGSSPLCPESNPVKTTGAVCRAAQSPCMEPAVCDGLTDVCPPNPVSAKGAPCTAGFSDNPCSPKGSCDGESQECPAREDLTDGTKCAWQPDSDFNVFKKDTTPHVSGFQSAVETVLPAAVQVLASLAARGRRPLAEQGLSSADSALWAMPRSVGGSSKARPLGVCQGTCASSKCVMTANRKGCCVLPGSRLAEDDEGAESKEGGDDGVEAKRGGSSQRGTEEDLYCWK